MQGLDALVKPTVMVIVKEVEAMSIEQQIRELGLELPAVKAPAANYADAVGTENTSYSRGDVQVTADGHIPKGKVGADVTTEEAARARSPRRPHLLAVLKRELGDLDRVRRIVKLLGMVNAVPDCVEHSKVINGCSDLFVEVFGKNMLPSSAIGVGSLLPFGVTGRDRGDRRGGIERAHEPPNTVATASRSSRLRRSRRGGCRRARPAAKGAMET